MTGPCMTYKGKLILPRYCTGAQQKTLCRRNSRRQEDQIIRIAPTVGQNRCFSVKFLGVRESRVMYPGVTLPATSGKESRNSDIRKAIEYSNPDDSLGRRV